jgi:Family of unknown function (DUF6220)
VTRAARYAYVILAWAFLVGVVVQVFFIGLGLFADNVGVELHATLGWILHLFPIVVLIAAALSRAGRSHWLWALALAAVIFVVPILATMRDSSPMAAAFHPVAAILGFWLSIVVARNSLEAFAEPRPAEVGDEPRAIEESPST